MGTCFDRLLNSILKLALSPFIQQQQQQHPSPLTPPPNISRKKEECCLSNKQCCLPLSQVFPATVHKTYPNDRHPNHISPPSSLTLVINISAALFGEEKIIIVSADSGLESWLTKLTLWKKGPGQRVPRTHDKTNPKTLSFFFKLRRWIKPSLWPS